VPPFATAIVVPFQVPDVTVPKKELPETESAVVEAYGNCEAATVDEAKKTPWVRMEEEVADVEVENEFREVKGYAKAAPVLVMVIGEAPIAVKDVHDTPVPQETEVVATLWSAPLPTPYKRLPDVKVVCPVPPFPTPRVPVMVESVVVATHVGIPLESARTNPLVDEATRESVVAAEA
jgi:hypothetical protein